MKKIIIFITIITLLALTGCGDKPCPEPELEPEGVEHIKYETIITEEILWEDVLEGVDWDSPNVQTWDKATNTWN